MNLNVKINKIKSIDNLEISLPIEKGLYAITGKNGSGKSTLVTCASTVFFNMSMKDYFGATDDDAYISFELNNSTRKWSKKNGKWIRTYTGDMNIKGFYEGSIIFGTRFRNTNFFTLKRLDFINSNKLSIASEFIRINLGKILHNDENYYDRLLKINNHDAGNGIRFSGDIFFYEKDNKRVSQFHMSTGENLLISILNSINLRNNDRASITKPCIMFLDEIELALHPSSLKRMILFLNEMSKIYNYAIYFSTHSIELISSISPKNIFFIERHADRSVEVINPCYPAYATRMLYNHSGYDYVFLVEDDLSRSIIIRLLKDNKLFSSKLIHVLPCGGYTNTIDLANEVVQSQLIGKMSSVSIILDGDVKEKSKEYIKNNNIKNNISLNFLPIQSLEKYLKHSLFDNADHKLFRILNDYIFHIKSLSEIIDTYKKDYDSTKDNNGKRFYQLIEKELLYQGKTREELIETIVNYLIETNNTGLEKIIEYLKSKLQ